jgi:hypothetical protein
MDTSHIIVLVAIIAAGSGWAAVRTQRTRQETFDRAAKERRRRKI